MKSPAGASRAILEDIVRLPHDPDRCAIDRPAQQRTKKRSLEAAVSLTEDPAMVA
jgi:hypothetical protein